VQLAAWRGDEPAVRELVAVAARGEHAGMRVAHWARAVLANGLGRHDEALSAAEKLAGEPLASGPVHWGLSELVEAAVKGGRPEAAAGAFARLEHVTSASGSEWALGMQARARALLEDDEARYREAIERLERTRIRAELARARLLYGEWLRGRPERDADARAQLRIAYEMLSRLGARGFGERARRALQEAGEAVRRPASAAREPLTAQEAQIARLAADGLTNPEIGARLFISPRTVEYHLRKVFTKLGISSRRELDISL
jgi:DNA-binding CsgD family transcriptional regulator